MTFKKVKDQNSFKFKVISHLVLDRSFQNL